MASEYPDLTLGRIILQEKSLYHVTTASGGVQPAEVSGKSTLINHLLGEERLKTGGLRNDDRGRHTTTHRELIILPDGAMVIDTPGMRELGMWDASEGINTAFADIEALADECRFSDCTHSGEPGCAVCKALAEGTLSHSRW